jgi:CO/xanthine dehydrogenase FAD-binding subunit
MHIEQEDHMKLPPLRYAAPATIGEACRLLADDPDAKAMAGGQSLMPLMAIRLSAPTTIVDLGRIPRLRRIELVDDHVRIGALTTHEQVIKSKVVRENAPLFGEAGRHIAHAAIRTRGTIGGSIAHGDGAAEWPLALLAAGGKVTVAGVRGERTLSADELFVGPFSTALHSDEVLTHVWIPRRTAGWAFGEFARRSGDYGLANVAVVVDMDGDVCRSARIAVGAAVGTVQRSERAEALVAGSPLDPATAKAAGAAAAELLAVIGDIHGSRTYRRHLVAALVERTLQEAGSRS